MSSLDPAAKLAAARTRLILDHPFLGALALRLPIREGHPRWCRTTATDARVLYYNANYLDRLSVTQAQFALAHEVMHCALGHFARRGHRIRHRWDLACDFAINPLLVDEGLSPPPEAIVMEPYRGMTAEEIYPCLDDNPEEDTLDQHLYDGDQGGRREEHPPGEAGDEPDDAGAERTASGAAAQPGEVAAAAAPPPLSAGERETLERQWRQHVATAAQQARQAGRMSAGMARMVDGWLEPTLPWRALLARHVSRVARTDYNYMRPSRREGEMILPSLREPRCEAVIAVDVSGSIGEPELAEFVGEINGIKGALPVRITLLACDAAIAPDGPWVCEPWETFRMPRQFSGGGGTSFVPVFDWVERGAERPDILVYFTDADGEFPGASPAYPVLWLVKGKRPVPWGTRVQMN